MTKGGRHAIFENEAIEPLIKFVDDEVLTTSQLSVRWQQSTEYLGYLRRMGRGVPWFHLPTGAVRYRLRDVVAAELRGVAGSLSTEHVILAVISCQAIPFEDRVKVIRHLRACLKTWVD